MSADGGRAGRLAGVVVENAAVVVVVGEIGAESWRPDGVTRCCRSWAPSPS